MTMPLSEKTALALDRLEKLHAAGRLDPATTAVAWTGGKDSTLTLHLWKAFLATTHPRARVRALNLDTGLEFPEILAFRDTVARDWRLDLRIVRPEFSPEEEAGAVPENKARCCLLRKIEPLKRGLAQLGVTTLLTGLRSDEHESRLERPWLEPMCEPPHNRVHLILEFTEMDVWAYAAEHDLPHCALYDQGYRSLGCAPCTRRPESENLGERAGRDPDKERILTQLHGLGYF